MGSLHRSGGLVVSGACLRSGGRGGRGWRAATDGEDRGAEQEAALLGEERGVVRGGGRGGAGAGAAKGEPHPKLPLDC